MTAANVGTMACHASSQINMAARPELRFENADSSSAREKALFIEHAVRWKKEFTMQVYDPLFLRVDVQVHRAVVIRPAVIFVETGDEIDGPVARVAPLLRQIAGQIAGAQSELVDRALQKISGQPGFREHHQVGWIVG